MTSSEPFQYFLEGNHSSKNIIVFLQGWPDNYQVWEALDHKHNLKDHEVLFINFPNTSKTQQQLKWGQDFPDSVQKLKAIFNEINLQKYEKKVIVGHDWGCMYTYLFDQTFPGTFDDIITLEIPPQLQLKTFAIKLVVFIYQWILILAFFVGGKFGRWVCKGFCKAAKHKPKYLDEMSGARCYPYYYFWKNRILSWFNLRRSMLSGYLPSVPVAFVCGQKKAFTFWGQKWQCYLFEHEKCELHKVDSDHWIMIEQPEFINDLINRRIRAIKK